MSGRKIDLVGKEYGRLTVIGEAPNKPNGSRMWWCRCVCGTEKTIYGSALTSGLTRSCGCLSKEVAAARFRTHGMAGRAGHAREYDIWRSMRRRCLKPSCKDWKDYGGRVIKVCDRWLHDFPAFLSDMGRVPPGYTIDRSDVNGHYEPGNCTWSSRLKQARNRRQRSTKLTRMIITDRKRTVATIQDWAVRNNAEVTGLILAVTDQKIPDRYVYGIPKSVRRSMDMQEISQRNEQRNPRMVAGR